MDKESKKIIEKLKDNEIQLYFGESCPACKKQIDDLNYSFGKLKKLKGAKNVEKQNYDVAGVPTWVNKFGDHIVGAYEPKKLLQKLNKKQKSGLKFGKTFARLYEQPQFMGHTPYGGQRGGQLPCSSENLLNWQNELHIPGLPLSPKPTGTKSRRKYGGLLKRPYGPRDNSDLKTIHLAGSRLYPFPLDWNYKLGQFGKKLERRKTRSRRLKQKSKKRIVSKKSRKKIARKISRRFSKKKNKKFGSTPGTKVWQSQLKVDNSAKWARAGKLEPAKGGNPDPALLYLPVKSKNAIKNKPPYLNIPAQYLNNQLNSPYPQSKVNPLNFGSFGNGRASGLVAMEGPNNVAYRPPFNVYLGAGSNTVNWTTNKTFLPSNKEILKVQKTTNNPTGWLSNTKGIKSTSSGFNTARTYTNKGLKFGEPEFERLKYTRDNMQQGAKILFQPMPPYMQSEVSGDYATYKKFGRSNKKVKKVKKVNKVNKNKKSFKKLKTQFGGKTITLSSTGKITISSNPKN